MSTKINILIKHLPKKLTRKAFYDAISRNPLDATKNESIDSEFGQFELSDLFINYIEPLDFHYELYENLYDLIILNYRDKNLREQIVEISKQIGQRKQSSVNIITYNVNGNSMIPGLSFLGNSGMGKSRLINLIIDLFPSKIHHKKEQIIQVPCVIINIPSGCYTKALCLSFFRVLDGIIGSDYHQQYARSGVTEEHLIDHMINKITIHAIGMIIIDEIHNLNDTPVQNSSKMFNFFKGLANKLKVPIIFIGTPDAEPLLNGNFQQARRSTGIGNILWSRLRIDDWNWKLLLNSLWQLQVFEIINPITTIQDNELKFNEWGNKISEAYYNETQGVIDLVIKLHYQLQKKALWLERKEITIDLIKIVTKTKFESLQNDLNKFREHSASVSNPIENNSSNSNSHSFSKSDKKSLIEKFKLFYPNLKQETIINAVEKVMSIRKNLSDKEIISKAVQLLNHGQPKTKKKAKRNELDITRSFIEVKGNAPEDVHKKLSKDKLIATIENEPIW